MPQDDKQNKTEKPTPHRLKKAREKGNVFRSQELGTVGLLVIGCMALLLGTPMAFHALEQMTSRIFEGAASTHLHPHTFPDYVIVQTWPIITLVVPLFFILAGGGVLLNAVQDKWTVTVEPLKPKLERISPLQGFKRIFSLKGLVQFAKTLLKIAIVVPIVYIAIQSHMDQILVLPNLPLTQILRVVGSIITDLVLQMLVAFAVLTAADFFYQRWQYKEDLKMSKKEIKDEHKEREGDPQIQSKRREFARELAQRPRLDHAVMKSDVVVTNPTHYAVALQYNPDEAQAPVVLGKGIRKRALKIKRLAAEMEVPIVENPPLARSLHASVEVDEEVPPELYPAVAAVLAEIYRQQNNYPSSSPRSNS